MATIMYADFVQTIARGSEAELDAICRKANDRSSLQKPVSQAAAVKQLCRQRPSVHINQIARSIIAAFVV
jgi:hypothetical protein